MSGASLGTLSGFSPRVLPASLSKVPVAVGRNRGSSLERASLAAGGGT